ncbi:ApaLI family restriction endonuclease [Prochlorococcus sp. MIT 0603]|uniref:ApaLI family restriction endonuclease n=1 Tax=unclassified Prochlorococcus TaxID=2627481 RepID=UPI0023A9E2D2|nr:MULTISPECIES: ApaLI family restriction endonuclease [unclassified Prochlorococcus]
MLFVLGRSSLNTSRRDLKNQDMLKTLYEGVNGKYYAREDAWSYIKNEIKIDLKKIIKNIASEN